MNGFLTLRRHWPEYAIEAALLGAFMLSACVFTVVLEHPASPVPQALPQDGLRRALNGLAMGLTAIGLIYSPWGQRSGAHLNPAVTATFLHLGRIQPWDAAFYMAAQFAGGIAGVLVALGFLGRLLAHPAVNHVVTVPGPAGAGTAFAAEVLIAAGMMLMVLVVTNTPRLARFTGLFAGLLVFLYITFEAPLSGMSLNPARTVASALPSGIWTAGWVYFAAPLLGMLGAARLHAFLRRPTRPACPKLHHGTTQRCLFCGHRMP